MIKPRTPVRKVSAYTLTDTNRKDKIKLDLNENNFGCSPRVIEAIKKATISDVSFYPEYGKLLSRLARYYNVSDRNILVTNGSDDAIRCIIDTYLDKGSHAIIPVPTFTMLLHYCKLGEAKIKEIPYNENLSFPAGRVLEAISEETRMIGIVNPNSPTGTSIKKDDLVQILRRASNAIVILDEAYGHYAGRSYMELIKEYPNLFVLSTFSKAFGLAGLRVGCVVSDPENIDCLQRVNPPFSVNNLAVAAVSAALDDREHLDSVVKETVAQKRTVRGELEKLGLETFETDTNFILVRTGQWTDRVWQRLKDQKILVKNLSDYPLLKGFLRITMGKEDENQRLIESMKDLLPPEAVLFDIDGVLVDESSSYRMAIKTTAEYFLEEEVTLSEIQDYKNRGGYNDDWDLTEALVKSRGRDIEREKIIERFQMVYVGEDFNGLIQNESWLLKHDILEKLHENFSLGIITGRPREEALFVLKRFGADKYFNVLVAMEDVPEGRGKPDPLGITKAMEELNVKRALYVGDTVDDIRAALSAGAVPVGVIASGAASPEAQTNLLKETGAKYVIKSVNEVMEVLK